MLTKIKRQDCLNQYKVFPLRNYDYKKDEEEFFYPEIFKSYILTLSYKTFQGHVNALGTELTNLTKAFFTDKLIFLGDTETSWLYQDNVYKPVKEAQQYLRDNKIGKRFNGALQVVTAELPTFIKHLAWLIRCNAALPNFNFTDKGQNIVGSICQYSNVHMSTLNEQADMTFKSFIDNSKFQYGNPTSCNNKFDKANALSGKQNIM